MIEIGKTVTRIVRTRAPGSKKLVPKLDANGQVEEKIVANEVWRVTKDALDGSFGKHSDRKLIVGLTAGDVLVLYPKGTRTAEVTLKLSQVYRYGMMCRANLALLEKARAIKQRKATARAERRANRPLRA